MLATKVDYSYKKDALRVTYDLETVRDMFTAAFIHDNAFTLMFFGNEQFDDLSDEELKGYIREYADRPHIRKWMGTDGDIDARVLRYRMGSDVDMKRLSRDINQIIGCRPLDTDREYAKKKGNVKFVEYCGYNSAFYDLNMLVLIKMMADKKKGRLTPSDIRELSNILIGYRGVPWKLFEHVEETLGGYLRASQMTFTKNLAIWADGHIDWAKIAMSDEDDNMVPPGLKTNMSNMGLDVIIDEDVQYDGFKTYSQKEREELVAYNFNDVLGTRMFGQLSDVVAGLEVRDTIRELYPYTGARAKSIEDIEVYGPEPRDVTSARLTQLVLVGPKKIKPVDSPAINYKFPVPRDGDLDDMVDTANFWEYMKSKEVFVPENLDRFFSYYEGKDVSTKELNRKVNAAQPVNHSSVMHVAYYRDGKPVDAGADVSTGGAHGSTHVGLRNFTESMIEEWTASGRKLKNHEKSTSDLKNVIHMDYVSFYPTNQSKLGAYITKEGIDRYTDIIRKRLDTKAEQKKHERYSPEWWRLEKLQLGYKLLLNSATGAGNLRQRNALLPLDNKTTAMRLIGNMLIWSLSQRITQAGGYVVSTNTDGIYVANMTLESVQPVIDQYIHDYGVVIEPEPMARFINRDVSTRIEMEHDPFVVDKIGGELKHGNNRQNPLGFRDSSLKGVPYPLICADAAIHYMVSDPDWLQKPYDPSVIRNYIEREHAKDEFKPSGWWHTYVGSKTRRLVKDGQIAQKINRIFLTKEGSHITADVNRQLTVGDSIAMWNQLLDGVTAFEDIKFEDVEGAPEFTGEMLEQGIENTTFDFVRSFKPYKTAETEYIPIGMKKEKIDPSDDSRDNVMKMESLKVLGYYNERLEKWETVKRWKSGKMEGYTSNVGVTANLYEELQTFDKASLDLEAYIKWAETRLQSWKVTGDVPEIGIQDIDDTVVPTHRKIRRTKHDDAVDLIREIYGLMEEPAETNA